MLDKSNGNKIRYQQSRTKGKGYSSSFYVKSAYADIVEASVVWCEKNDINFSTLICNLILRYFLIEGNDLMKDYRKILNNIKDKNLEETYIIYRGVRTKLTKVLQQEFVVNDALVKIEE